MNRPFSSIHGAKAAIWDLLWHLSARRFRMASTSEELLDLFEKRYAVPDERLPVTSSDREDKPCNFAPGAAPAVFASEVVCLTVYNLRSKSSSRKRCPSGS